MSEEMKNQNSVEVKKENAQPELTETDLKNISGGAITGESTKSGAEGWIEIFSFSSSKVE
jgi:bacteriocin-like protein